MIKSQNKTLFLKATLSVVFLATVLFLAGGIISVQAQSEDLASVQEASGLADTSLPALIGLIIHVFLGILGVVFLVLVIYGGWLWMTAGGDGEKVDQAKKIFINATVGLIIILASYAITSYIVNLLTDAIAGDSSSSSSTSVSVERLSGSLGAGALKDHFPDRNATDVARNIKIFVTFKDTMNIESFISGYDTADTPEDVSDDVAATALNTDNILIYASADGENKALDSSDVSVSFTDDLQTFVFDPPILGSATEDVSYTVYLDDAIEDTDGDTVLNSGGYEWSFTVGTEIDLEAPTVKSVIPVAGGEYDRNIVVQINFSEAMDPTSATGTRESDSGFDNIQTYDVTDSVPLAGVYQISNDYKTITFTTSDACGTNSCGETIYCLPSSANIGVTIYAATPGETPPQTDTFPFDGVVDMAGNALDGNGDDTAGDDYVWDFTTTNNIQLGGPEISSITPNIKEGEIDLDAAVQITFDSALMSSSVSSTSITLTPSPTHELWYKFSSQEYAGDGEEVKSGDDVAATIVSVRHGVFLESSEEEDGIIYLYGTEVTDGVKNEYQNCFVPGEGPDASGGSCGTSAAEPFCCNGVPGAAICELF